MLGIIALKASRVDVQFNQLVIDSILMVAFLFRCVAVFYCVTVLEAGYVRVSVPFYRVQPPNICLKIGICGTVISNAYDPSQSGVRHRATDGSTLRQTDSNHLVAATG